MWHYQEIMNKFKCWKQELYDNETITLKDAYPVKEATWYYEGISLQIKGFPPPPSSIVELRNDINTYWEKRLQNSQ